MNKLLYSLKKLFGNDYSEDQLDREITFHIEMSIQQKMDMGMTNEQARKEVMREFGGIEQIKESTRESWGVRSVLTCCRELSLTLRQLYKRPRYSLVIIITLAVCVGLNIIGFKIVDSLYLNPGLYKDENRIVRIADRYNLTNTYDSSWGTSFHFYREREEQSELVENIGFYQGDDVNIHIDNEHSNPEFLSISHVTPSLFEVFGVQPLLGRVFTQEDLDSGDKKLAVLTYHYWATRCNKDKDIIDQTVWISTIPYKIVGVMPKNFVIPRTTSDGRQDLFTKALYVPFIRPVYYSADNPRDRNIPYGGCFARLKSGATVQQLELELNAINQRNGPQHPVQYEYEQNSGHHTYVKPLREDLVRNAKSALAILVIALALFLVIGCVNISALALNRNMDRLGEIGIRLSLGASRGQLFRFLLMEMVILIILGAILALCLASAGLQWMSDAKMLAYFVIMPQPGINENAVLFAIALALAVVVIVSVIGLLPVFRNAGRAEISHEDTRVGSGSKKSKVHKGALLFAQLTATVILLIASGLLFRSFLKILEIDPGFDSEQIMTAAVRPPNLLYDGNERSALMEKIIRELSELPYVEAVGEASWGPLKLQGAGQSFDLLIERDMQNLNKGNIPECYRDSVNRGYFDVFGIPFLRGRNFSAAEQKNRSAVAIIDEKFANLHFPGEDPIGKRIAVTFAYEASTNQNLNWLTIVGVVPSIKTNNLLNEGDVLGQVFQSRYMHPPWWINLFVKAKTPIELSTFLGDLQTIVDRENPHIGIGFPETMDEIIQRNYQDQQNLLGFGVVVGMLSLLICVLGLVGSIANSVGSQTKEIGIRMALGARTGLVLWGCMSLWVHYAFAGILAGFILMLSLSGHLAPFLYQVSHIDILTYATVVSLLATIVITAACFSARRATRINPVVALRAE